MYDKGNVYWEQIKNNPDLEPDQEVISFLEALDNGELVETFNVKKAKGWFSCSFLMIKRGSIGCITPTLELAHALKRVIGDGKVLEVAAGTGILAKFLHEAGVNIISTDDFSWYEHGNPGWKPRFAVEKADYRDAILQHQADFLLLCWPYMDDLAADAAKLFTALNPNGKIIYIGEWGGGLRR